MARGGKSSSARSAPAAPARRAAAPPPPPPAPVHHSAPPPATMQSSGGGMGAGLMATMAQGVAFGAGSEVAHQAVRSFMGGGSGSSGHAEPAAAPAAAAPMSAASTSAPVCQMPQQDLYKCLQEQNGNVSACQYYFDALKQCQQNGSF